MKASPSLIGASILCAYSPQGHAFTTPSSRKLASRPSRSFDVSSASAATTLEVEDESSTSTPNSGSQSRTLCSQELLMLPRQYRPKLDEGNPLFPSMSHVSVTTLSATPSIEALSDAIEIAMDTHPLLRCHVEGDGEPDERIDLFKMVRRGEPNPCTFVAPNANPFKATDVLEVVSIEGDDEDLRRSWQENFNNGIDDGSWYESASIGPLWKLTLHRLGNETSSSDSPCALLFSSNHAISDQGSVNVLMDQIISDVASIESDGGVSNKPTVQGMPMAMEDSVLGLNNRWSDVQTGGIEVDTIKYVAGKAAEGFRGPVILPDTDEEASGGDSLAGALSTISGKSAGGESKVQRRTTLQFRNLSEQTTSKLLQSCRANGVSVTNALTAAMSLTATDFIDGGCEKEGKKRNYKVLQSLDMRRFGEQLDKCETVACMAGSNDLMLGPLPDRSGQAFREEPDSAESRQLFWNLAKESKSQTEDFVDSGGPTHAVRVFDFAMSISDMNNLVDLTAKSNDSLGRAYSAGVSNNGVYERQKAVKRDGEKDRVAIQTKHGKYEVQDIYFGTPHSRSGCLYQVSTMTVNGSLKLTFHPSSILSDATNKEFADAFVGVLEKAANTKVSAIDSIMSNVPGSVLPLIAAGYGIVGLAIHSEAWSEFFYNLSIMKDNVADPKDFWDAFNFWVGHPILQPILWISDVLHGSPGPMVGDLVPLSFILGNVAFIGLTAFSKQFRGALNIFALSAFLNYVGAGLDGQAGLGDFNLQLNDSYKGQVVKGCPAYDDVKQPSMNDFELNKYQGKWYEMKFHDWTQFKEVYDTTLDIKLTADGKGWIDDFGVKGPSPEAAPLSWDKSPVANGAHYFLFGRVDENDPPGILREKGFGVEFPNYIVDVKKDPATGEYTEAIQFQCLERGGVRVFEGINFMSRKPTMTDDELSAMHHRAAAAGMNPYGAAEEQMHLVGRRDENLPKVDNNWQQMWRAIGVDKLLELLTESIEDGGR